MLIQERPLLLYPISFPNSSRGITNLWSVRLTSTPVVGTAVERVVGPIHGLELLEAELEHISRPHGMRTSVSLA